MALSDFVEGDESSEEQYHDNPKLDKEKLWVENLCPDCGGEAEHVRGNEWRCTNDCETITYRHTPRAD